MSPTVKITAEGLITIRTSMDTDQISPALVKATTQISDVYKGEKAHKYSYADLPSVLAVVRPVLITCQLACLQGQVLHLLKDQQTYALGYDGVMCATRLLHVSGQWIEAYTAMPSDRQGGPHGQGSAYTYARRYGLLALLGISATDDDGAAAQQARQRQAAPAAPAVDPDQWPASQVEVASARDQLRRLWHAKLGRQPFRLTDDERHRVQRAAFGFSSLSDIPETAAVGKLERLRKATDSEIQALILRGKGGSDGR